MAKPWGIQWAGRGLVFLALAFLFAVFPAQRASAQDVASLFPEPDRLAADYPDDPERYAALSFLWQYLHEKSPDAASAKARRGAYYNASESIRAKYLAMGETPAIRFDNRIRELSGDRDFQHEVLARYGLLNVTAEAAPPPMRNADVTDSMIQAAFWKALPVLLVTLLLMVVITKAIVRFTVASPTLHARPPVPLDGVPQLPDALRTIQVPGMRYTVEFCAGQVLDKESAIHTRQVTTTTPAQSYEVGNTVYFTPSQTTSSSTSTQVDTVWVLMPDRRESSWTFSGGTFKLRPGHVISTISRRVTADRNEFILAYNHTTGQLEQLSGSAHATRGFKAWVLATLIGSIGFAIWIGIILSIQEQTDDPLDRLLSPIVYWIEGLLPAAFIAWIIGLRAQAKVMRSRNARFASRHLPGLQQFLAQATPSLQKLFGKA